MSNDDLLTDDYVADLLAKDANDCSIKYSAMGMDAFHSAKKPANMPKPNTRFLRHIIKDTDTHNKALLAKESAESKARLEGLEQAEEVKRLKTNPNTRDIRRRQLGDIHAILGRPKRRRDDGDDKGTGERDSGRNHSTSRDRRGHPRSKNDDLIEDRHSHKKRHGRLEQDNSSSRDSRKDSERRSRRTRDRHSDSDEDDSRRKRHSKQKSDRSRSPEHHRRRHRSRSAEPLRSKYRDRSPTRRSEKHVEKHRMSSKHHPSNTASAKETDSDPLDDIIGPMPAPKPRGRGALAGSSGIDRRFSETYDPRTDVQMEHNETGGNHWDDAVESFRDRQKLKQNQEARMRSAGFADTQIQKIQGNAGSDEQAEADVQWTMAGEKREWDRGKVSEDEADLVGLLSGDM